MDLTHSEPLDCRLVEELDAAAARVLSDAFSALFDLLAQRHALACHLRSEGGVEAPDRHGFGAAIRLKADGALDLAATVAIYALKESPQ